MKEHVAEIVAALQGNAHHEEPDNPARCCRAAQEIQGWLGPRAQDDPARLRIEAVLHAEPAPESVTYDTLVDPMTDNIVVRPGNVV